MDETTDNAEIPPVEEKKRRGPRIKSRVWEFFVKLDNIHAMCKICHLKMSYKTSVTNLKRHMLRQHEFLYKTRLSETPEQELDLVLEGDDAYYVEIGPADEAAEPSKKRAKIEILHNQTNASIEYDRPREDAVYHEEADESERAPEPRIAALNKSPVAHGVIQAKDEYSVFGELVALRLRKMKGAKKRAILQNRITQMLFVAEMEDLK